MIKRPLMQVHGGTELSPAALAQVAGGGEPEPVPWRVFDPRLFTLDPGLVIIRDLPRIDPTRPPPLPW
ncbi:MAG: hypothetical protein K8W52_00405 [Deltaproteobacteria bacterium]|nr:hypothetical protein [Deltaproteobacteria bacterium]